MSDIDRLAVAIGESVTRRGAEPMSHREARAAALAVIIELDDEMALSAPVQKAGLAITEYATDAMGDMLKTMLQEDRIEHGVN